MRARSLRVLMARAQRPSRPSQAEIEFVATRQRVGVRPGPPDEKGVALLCPPVSPVDRRRLGVPARDRDRRFLWLRRSGRGGSPRRRRGPRPGGPETTWSRVFRSALQRRRRTLIETRSARRSRGGEERQEEGETAGRCDQVGSHGVGRSRGSRPLSRRPARGHTEPARPPQAGPMTSALFSSCTTESAPEYDRRAGAGARSRSCPGPARWPCPADRPTRPSLPVPCRGPG